MIESKPKTKNMVKKKPKTKKKWRRTKKRTQTGRRMQFVVKAGECCACPPKEGSRGKEEEEQSRGKMVNS